MNEVSLCGKLASKPIELGHNEKTYRFILRVPHKFIKNGETVTVHTLVPCKVFRCPEKLAKLLLEHGKNLHMQTYGGRIETSTYYTADNEKRYTTEVILDPLKVSAQQV